MIDRVSVLIVKDGKLLSARSRGKEVFYIPGGKREPGESDRETLLRETREELGVGLLSDSIVFFGAFTGPAHGKPAGTVLCNRCYLAEPDGIPIPSSEVEELRWQGMEALSSLPPADEKVYRALFEQGLIRYSV